MDAADGLIHVPLVIRLLPHPPLPFSSRLGFLVSRSTHHTCILMELNWPTHPIAAHRGLFLPRLKSVFRAKEPPVLSPKPSNSYINSTISHLTTDVLLQYKPQCQSLTHRLANQQKKPNSRVRNTWTSTNIICTFDCIFFDSCHI